MGLPSCVPSYSWINVNVGLVTSSGSAASRACAIPFTRVVLPAPSSPRSKSNCGGLSKAASLRPTSTVSAPLRVVNSCTRPSATGASLLIQQPRGSALLGRLFDCSTNPRRFAVPRQPLQPNITVIGTRAKAKSLRKVQKCVRGQQGVLLSFAHRKICRQAVQENRRFDGCFRLLLVLSQQPRHKPGQHIAASSLRHGGVAGGIHGHAAVAMSNQRARALQDHGNAVLPREGTRPLPPVRLHLSG